MRSASRGSHRRADVGEEEGSGFPRRWRTLAVAPGRSDTATLRLADGDGVTLARRCGATQGCRTPLRPRLSPQEVAAFVGGFQIAQGPRWKPAACRLGVVTGPSWAERLPGRSSSARQACRHRRHDIPTRGSSPAPPSDFTGGAYRPRQRLGNAGRPGRRYAASAGARQDHSGRVDFHGRPAGDGTTMSGARRSRSCKRRLGACRSARRCRSRSRRFTRSRRTNVRQPARRARRRRSRRSESAPRNAVRRGHGAQRMAQARSCALLLRTLQGRHSPQPDAYARPDEMGLAIEA